MRKQTVTQQLKIEFRRPLKKIQHSVSRNCYLRSIGYFAEYCRKNHGCKTTEECKKHIQEYVNNLVANGKSASTISTYLAAICKFYHEPMSNYQKPIRHISEFKRGRYYDASPEHYRENRDLSNPKWTHIVKFQEIVGIRRQELAHLRGRDFMQDESQAWCVLVEKGKGGKRQLQRIPKEDVPFIRSYFEAKKPDEFIFEPEELNNGLNFHMLRAEVAKKAYKDYVQKFSTVPGYRKQLEQEVRRRWNSTCMDAKAKRPRPLKTQDLTGYYCLRGQNRTFAQAHHLDLRYDKLAVLAVSIFHLSHFRNNVTILNYLLAVTQ